MISKQAILILCTCIAAMSLLLRSLRTPRLSAFAHRKMSSGSIISSLPSPLRDLIANASPRDEDYGVNEKDKAEVSDWISKVASGDIVQPSAVRELDATLAPKTYLVSNYLTAADVALYGALHPTLVSHCVVCTIYIQTDLLGVVTITTSAVLFTSCRHSFLRSYPNSPFRPKGC